MATATLAGYATPFSWKNLALGAGGFVRGLDIHTDGTKVCRCDTYGAFVWNPPWCAQNKWIPLCRASALPANDPLSNYQELSSGTAGGSSATSLGVFSICIAPSNSSYFAMMWGGYVYLSTNKGQTWQNITGNLTPDTTQNANQQSKFGGFDYKIAFDPVNINIIVIGSGAGIFYTSTAGSSNSWIQITTVATPTDDIGACCIAFDPSTSSGGSTPGIYIESYGHGVYNSSTGPGGTFTLTTSGPTTARMMRCGPDGFVYLVPDTGGSSGSLWIYNGSSWSTTSISGLSGDDAGGFGGVDFDPATSGSTTHISVTDNNGNLTLSTNRGTSFASIVTANWGTSTQIPWLAAEVGQPNGGSPNGTFICSCVKYDPSQSNTLYMSEGVGVAWTNPSTSTISWNDQSIGIEQLVSGSLTSIPSGNLIYTAFDRPVFSISNPSTYPSGYGVKRTGTGSLNEGFPASYCPSAPGFVALIADNANTDTDGSGWSANGGGNGAYTNWTQFTSLPSDLSLNVGAQIVCVAYNSTGPTATVVLFIGDDSIAKAASGVWQGTLSGTTWTWTDITISGVSGGWCEWSTSSNQTSVQRKICDIDAAGTIFAYNYGGRSSTAGVYTSTNNGASFSLATSGRFDTADNFNAHLRCVPGEANNAFYASGFSSGQPSSNNTDFYRTTDGSTWAAISGVTNVNCFGFGAPQTSGGYPTLYIFGCVGGSSVANLGVWMSTNASAATPTWNKVHGQTPWNTAGGGTFPFDTMDPVVCVEGDMNNFGWGYVGLAGSGALYFGPL